MMNRTSGFLALGVTAAWYDSVHGALTSVGSFGFKGAALLAIAAQLLRARLRKARKSGLAAAPGRGPRTERGDPRQGAAAAA